MLMVDTCSPKSSSNQIQTNLTNVHQNLFLWGNNLFSLEIYCSSMNNTLLRNCVQKI